MGDTDHPFRGRRCLVNPGFVKALTREKFKKVAEVHHGLGRRVNRRCSRGPRYAEIRPFHRDPKGPAVGVLLVHVQAVVGPSDSPMHQDGLAHQRMNWQRHQDLSRGFEA
jgi:hypothetical protein